MKKSTKEVNLRDDLRERYNITLEQYNILLESQNYVCAICKQPFRENKQSKRLQVDHNHVTNRIRGLLCLNCNAILGHAKDSVDILLSCVAYLKRG